jgi:cell wall-associated NlpC family hydrolase
MRTQMTRFAMIAIVATGTLLPSHPAAATGSLEAVNSSVREAASAKVAQYALTRVGDPYVYGAEGPDAFDCSGLVYWSYRQAGYKISRSTQGQYSETYAIRRADLKPGDLIFYGSHVAIATSGTTMVEAYNLHNPVRQAAIRSGATKYGTYY